MKRRVSAGEARTRLGELLDAVYHRSDEVVIERDGKPMAVAIPYERYQALERDREESRERFFDAIRQIHEHNKDVPYEVIQAEVDAAIREVREERRLQREQAERDTAAASE
jgi:prevent-host-death family protein